MNLAEDPAPGKLNPFYKPSFGKVIRREFLGLMAATFGWVMLPATGDAQEKKGKGGGEG